jgi:hypothetical protein
MPEEISSGIVVCRYPFGRIFHISPRVNHVIIAAANVV